MRGTDKLAGKGENARKIAILEGNLQRPEVRVATMSMQYMELRKETKATEMQLTASRPKKYNQMQSCL